MKIPFNRTCLGEEEIRAAMESIKSGKIGGNGPIGRRVERLIADMVGSRFVFLTTSCTHALEMALMILGIEEGDEVIMPSFSFVSAANAVMRLKAKPVFVDVGEDLNIDPLKIELAITRKTKAIICIHYAGIPCRMKEIMGLAKRYNLYIIEDAAQALGSRYKERYLGTIGDIGCLSFHETKNFTCGEGGAFLTNAKAIAKKADIAREKGTNRSAYLNGEVDKYTWFDIGSSYVLSDILAAVLLEQVKKVKHIINERKTIGLRYMKGLESLEYEDKIMLPSFDIDGSFNWHLFYFRVFTKKHRDYILRRLWEKGIGATFHFQPLHLSPYSRKMFEYKKGDFPVTEKASETLIRLPLYPALKKKEQEYIIDSIHKILKK